MIRYAILVFENNWNKYIILLLFSNYDRDRHNSTTYNIKNIQPQQPHTFVIFAQSIPQALKLQKSVAAPTKEKPPKKTFSKNGDS